LGAGAGQAGGGGGVPQADGVALVGGVGGGGGGGRVDVGPARSGDSCAFIPVLFRMDDTQGVASPQSLSQCFKSSWFRWEAQRLVFVGNKSGILI